MDKVTPSISLSNLKKKIREPEKKEQEVVEEVTTREDYTKADLEASIKAYAENLKAQNKANKYTILNREIELDNDQVHLKLDNPVQLDMLEEFRSDLVQYLRKKLNNRNISLQGTYTPEEGKKLIYTQKEKFDHLAEKQPLLKELKDKLGLDPEF